MISWDITANAAAGTLRFSPTYSAPNFVDVSLLVPGDYVNIFGVNFSPANQGSYSITNVVVDYVFGSVSQYFEVSNPVGIAQSGVTQILSTDLVFFRPHRATLNDSGSRTVVVAQTDDGLDIIIPATTDAISRGLNSGAYLHSADPVLLTSFARNSSGLVTATSLDHGLSTGQWVFVDGVYPDNTALHAGGRLNGLFQITIIDSNTFSYKTADALYVTTGTGGTVTPIAAPSTAIAGPFIYDPDKGSSITGVETTSSQDLVEGVTYRTITVTDASAFPDMTGYLAFGFGTSTEVRPVRYLGRISSTELLLDPSFAFPQSVPSGSTVTLLTSREPWVPTSPEVAGTFYLTAAAAGRLEAEKTIQALVGAGLNVTITVVFPGDRGLGNEGLPVAGAQKLSDALVVWGSDDIDADLAEARGS